MGASQRHKNPNTIVLSFGYGLVSQRSADRSPQQVILSATMTIELDRTEKNEITLEMVLLADITTVGRRIDFALRNPFKNEGIIYFGR